MTTLRLRMAEGPRRHSSRVERRDDYGPQWSGSVYESDRVVKHSYFGGAAGKREGRAPENPKRQCPDWGGPTGGLNLKDRVYLSHFLRAVRRYEMGGYPILKKWLVDRDARHRDGAPLTLAGLANPRGISHRIAALLLLRTAMDDACEKANPHAWLINELTGEASAK